MAENTPNVNPAGWTKEFLRRRFVDGLYSTLSIGSIGLFGASAALLAIDPQARSVALDIANQAANLWGEIGHTSFPTILSHAGENIQKAFTGVVGIAKENTAADITFGASVGTDVVNELFIYRPELNRRRGPLRSISDYIRRKKRAGL